MGHYVQVPIIVDLYGDGYRIAQYVRLLVGDFVAGPVPIDLGRVVHRATSSAVGDGDVRGSAGIDCQGDVLDPVRRVDGIPVGRLRRPLALVEDPEPHLVVGLVDVGHSPARVGRHGSRGLVPHVRVGAVQGLLGERLTLRGQVAGLVHCGLGHEQLDVVQVVAHLIILVTGGTGHLETGPPVQSAPPALDLAVVQDGACECVAHVDRCSVDRCA